jgi:uncharacterized membrane protein
MAIQTPPGWGWDQLRAAAHEIGSASPREYWHRTADSGAVPTVRRIGLADLKAALAAGLDDFKAHRTDVIFLCVIYPALGVLMGAAATSGGLLPILFPLISGFALIGPFAAVGINEMSRRREQGEPARWIDAFGVLRSPSIGAIALLGLLLVGLFILWLIVAEAIYILTLGPKPPGSLAAFADGVLFTPAGWAMIIVGVGVGLLFAVAVLAISVVSFPLLLDRNVGIDIAVSTSVRAVTTNPGVMAVWGAIIVAGLILGSLPALVGLAVVLPILGHATWHLYRRLVVN